MKYVFIFSILCSLLFGCGGGGGDSDTSGSPANRAPIADAGPNQSTNPGQPVSLSGARSSDPDGDPLTYSWSIASSPDNASPALSSETAEQTNFSASEIGTYEIQLSVSDGAASSTDIVTVNVVEPDSEGPVADAGGSYSAPEGVDIPLDGSASSSVSGALSYSWSIKSAPATSSATLLNPGTPTPTLQSTSVGNYEVELVVTAEDGNTETDVANVLVVDYLPIMQKVDHYTQILPGDDSHIIYVSNQDGDDANSGLSSNDPVKSIQRGISLLRDGYPDWLALKSGDTWNTGIGAWAKSGRSQSEPMVITSYGHGDQRPLLRTNGSAFRFQGGGGSPEFVNHLVIHGLHFYAANRDPNAPEFSGANSDRGIFWLRGTNGLLIEDNMFQFYKEAIALQETDGFDIRNVLIKNNVIVDSYNVSGDHAQGIFLDKTDNVRIERNVFDHIGWNTDVAGADKTKFNHSIYVQTTNRNIEVVDNIITRSSSHGVQLRSGGLMQGNVLVRNAIALMLGGDSGQGDPGFIDNNVILHGSDISADEPRGWGIDFGPGIVSAEVENNIIAHEDSEAPSPMAIASNNLSTQSNNAIFNWGDQSQPASTFPEPTRTIQDFDAQAGGQGTIDSFIENVRSHSLRKPKPKYDVEEIRLYFENAYGIKK
ncbi:right-handed parallel beta-helix repeat-containing protein [Microbulbifer salipaludis]|uniref:Right-handed parallel beta-helix repeat-containing protein n=1 Tax=Microbulbifer salipaludis TaxID=187980 RepID=A0ABS3E2D5_9GAMM|nr:right-handed parallel beta-helix repeat-containing protein [Microbulbifer salipaludis]MBN8429459.1 right-handed parallel beta-helix repeat-containing protein [Microbulbifer salipaludis]